MRAVRPVSSVHNFNCPCSTRLCLYFNTFNKCISRAVDKRDVLGVVCKPAVFGRWMEGLYEPSTWSNCKQWEAYGFSLSNNDWDDTSHVRALRGPFKEMLIHNNTQLLWMLLWKCFLNQTHYYLLDAVEPLQATCISLINASKHIHPIIFSTFIIWTM